MADAAGDKSIDDLLQIGIAAMSKQLDRYADTKTKARRIQEACAEATTLENQKIKRNAQNEGISGLASGRKVQKIASKKEKSSTALTEDTKRDLQVLGLRNYIDKKKHYKKSTERVNKAPKFFQIGTIVGGAKDYYSMDGPAREVKNKSLAEQLLANSDQRKWRKQKYLEIQEKHSAGGRKQYQKQIKSRRASWAPTKM